MKLRIKNATLFVTVLSACLGLVAAGASSHAQRASAFSLSEITEATSAVSTVRRAARPLRKRTPHYNQLALNFIPQPEEKGARVPDRDANSFTVFQQTLVVTRLPRASIEA